MSEENGVRLICFEICNEKFAFSMEFLVEIVQTQRSDITPFFTSIPLIRGRWDYRGSSLYVIDLRDFFGLEDRQEEEHQSLQAFSAGNSQKEHVKENRSKNILVVKLHDRMFGLLTDAVLQVLPLVDFYEYPNMISTLPKRYFAGVTVIENELILLLALQEFIRDDELETLLSQEENSEDLVRQSTD